MSRAARKDSIGMLVIEARLEKVWALGLILQKQGYKY